MNALAWAGQARKFLAAVSGAVAEAVSLGLLSGTAEHYVTAGLAVATAFLVYLVPNDQPVVASVIKPQPSAPFSGGNIAAPTQTTTQKEGTT